jgi:predicted MFS family arabinose efflux permease
MPLRIFRNRNRTGAYVIMLCLASAMFATFFFVTQYLQNVQGWSPMKTGVGFLPMPALIMVTSMLMARKVVGRVGVRIPLTIGPMLVVLAMLLLSRLDPSSTYPYLLLCLSLMAVGMGCNFVPLTITAVSGVDQHESGLASALLNTGQQLGGALGLATLGTVAAHSIRGYGQDLAAEHHGKVTSALANEAIMHGYDDAFRVAAAMVTVAFLVAVFVIRVPKRVARAEVAEGVVADPAT